MKRPRCMKIQVKNNSTPVVRSHNNTTVRNVNRTTNGFNLRQRSASPAQPPSRILRYIHFWITYLPNLLILFITVNLWLFDLLNVLSSGEYANFFIGGLAAYLIIPLIKLVCAICGVLRLFLLGVLYDFMSKKFKISEYINAQIVFDNGKYDFWFRFPLHRTHI